MLKIRWIFAVLLFAAIFIGSSVQSANATENDLAPPPGGWEFSMTPYGWVNFITGDQTAGGTTESVNTNIFEIIDATDELYAFMSYARESSGSSQMCFGPG